MFRHSRPERRELRRGKSSEKFFYYFVTIYDASKRKEGMIATHATAGMRDAAVSGETSKRDGVLCNVEK